MAVYVTYTYDLYDGSQITGGNRRFIELMWALAEQGDTVHIFIPEDSKFPAHKNIFRHAIKRPKRNLLFTGFIGLILNYSILRTIRKIDYDTLILVSVPYGIQGALLGLKKISLIIWEDIIACRRIQLKNKKNQLLQRGVLKLLWFVEGIVLKKAMQIIVQCNYDRNELIRRHHRQRNAILSKSIVLPNNVNPAWIKEDAYLLDAKVSYNQNDLSSLNICFVGNVNDERKGLHLLLEAGKQLIAENYNIQLFIIGDGRLMKWYKEKYADLSEILFLGNLTKPLIELNKADLLVVPSLVDSFPNTVMEGLFLEKTVIGAKTGGIPEMLHYEELLFDPEVEALSGKIAAIIDNHMLPQLKKLSIERKRKLTFDWGKAMRKVLAIKKEV